MTVTPMRTVTPNVTLGSGSLPGELLTVRVERALGVPGRATVRCEAPWDWAPTSAPYNFGDPLTVSDKDGHVLFKGEITGVNVEVHRGRRELQLVAHDHAHRLALGTHTDSYVGRSPSQLVRTITDRHGLTLSTSVSDGSGPDDYLPQDGTDLDLLDHLSARTGRVWWVEPTESGRHTLRWEPIGTSTTTVTIPIGEVLSFELRASGMRSDSVRVIGWNPVTGQPVAATQPVQVTGAPVVASGFPGSSTSPRELVVRHASPLTSEEATQVASAIASATAADAMHSRGEVRFHHQIAPSTTVKLVDAGALDADYLVTSVEHVFDPLGGTTRFIAGPARRAGLADLLSSPADAGQLIEGVVPAVVTDVGDPKKAGRVKVKYAVGENKLQTHWARVLTLGAGPSRGLEFLPETDDEVLVAFELGDTRRPVVLGGLYSQARTLPPSPTAGNHQNGMVVYRRITTRMGHVIELADVPGSADQYILIELAGKKHRIRLGGDKTDITTDGTAITVTNAKATVTLADNGDVNLEGANVTIKATKNITLEASSAIKVKATGEVGVEGMAVAVKGQTKAEVSAGGQVAVKGGTVMIN